MAQHLDQPKHDRRLRVSVQVICEGLEPVQAIALVDTGCEVNLMRGDLIPASCFLVSQQPHRLKAANQNLLLGGQLEANVKLRINGIDYDTDRPVELDIPIKCHNVKISHDIMLSYSWLVANRMDIIPRQHGMMILQEDSTIWWPGIREAPVFFIS